MMHLQVLTQCIEETYRARIQTYQCLYFKCISNVSAPFFEYIDTYSNTATYITEYTYFESVL